MKPKHTKHLVLLRFIFTGGVVALAVLMGQLGVPILSGMLAAFPVLTISSLIAVQMDEGSRGTFQARGMTMSMTVSIMLLSIPYCIAVHYLYPSVGIIYGTVISFAVAIAIGIPYYFIVEDRLVPSFDPYPVLKLPSKETAGKITRKNERRTNRVLVGSRSKSPFYSKLLHRGTREIRNKGQCRNISLTAIHGIHSAKLVCVFWKENFSFFSDLDRAGLFEDIDVISYVPIFCKFAINNTININGSGCDLLSCGGKAHELTLVGSSISDSDPHFIPFGNDVFDHLIPIGEGVQTHVDQLFETISADIVGMVDIIRRNEIIDQIQITVIVGINETANNRFIIFRRHLKSPANLIFSCSFRVKEPICHVFETKVMGHDCNS